MHANYLDTLDWGILIAYFLILIGIGIWASLKRKKGSSLFLAERSLKWHHIGFSMWGTNVGPSMLIASASAGFTTGIVSLSRLNSFSKFPYSSVLKYSFKMRVYV